MRTLCLLIAAAVAFAAGPPNFSGTYVLENLQSKSDFTAVSKMVIGQSANHFAMTQADKDGLTAHNVQGACLLDGIRHAVPEADDDWIDCRWEGSVLVTEQTWNGARQRRTTRTQSEQTANSCRIYEQWDPLESGRPILSGRSRWRHRSHGRHNPPRSL